MSVWQHKRGGWYLGLRWPGGRREQVYLGTITQQQAQFIDARVLELQKSRPLGVPLSVETITWMQALDGPLHNWLLKLGLVDAKPVRVQTTLGEWCDKYIDSRSDYSAGTKKGWKTAKNHMVSAFPAAKMHEITAFQAHQFARDLTKTASSEHASKIVERISQLYKAAIQAKILVENPFSDVKIAARPDKSRGFYLEKAISVAVMDACPNAEAKAVFALARWCGLRVPHEPYALTWQHIDFKARRITVPGKTKTGSRILPLFDGALQPLLDLKEKVPKDQEHVIDKARASSGTACREWLLVAIANAGLHGWPKLYHNLRASCRTDLEEIFPSHVCDAWLGHSSQVAKDHYLMVTPTDWEKALNVSQNIRPHRGETLDNGCAEETGIGDSAP